MQVKKLLSMAIIAAMLVVSMAGTALAKRPGSGNGGGGGACRGAQCH